MNFVKKYWKYFIIFILCITFFSLLLSVLNKSNLGFDKMVYEDFIFKIRNDDLTMVLKIITSLSNPLFLIVLSVVIFFLIKSKKEKGYFVFNICFITLINQLLKYLIIRPRPSLNVLIQENGYSFPSGHAMASVAFYGYLIHLLWQSKWSKTYKYIGTVILIVLILAICFSRIYLGAHYTSDIIAGICLSLIHLIIYISILKKKES